MGIYYGHGFLDAEVGGQKSEVRGQRSWILNRRTAEPQNKEPQNVEVFEYFIIRNSLFDIRYSNRDQRPEVRDLRSVVKSQKMPFSVIPAKAGIQSFQAIAEHLDSGFHRSDDFLRDYQL